MALQKNVVSVPLSQGLDTKTDPKQLQIGRLTSIRNLTFDEIGDLSPRNGYAALTQNIVNTGAISVGRTLATLNASLVLSDGSNLYSYAESLAKWTPKGQKTAVSLSTFPVTGAATNATIQDSALHSGGAAIYTWSDSVAATVSYSVLDTSTKATIVQEGGDYTGTHSKPVVISTNSSFTWFIQNAGNLQYSSVTLANPASSTAPSTLLTITSGSAPFDVCTGFSHAYVFYVDSGGDIAVTKVSSANAVVTTSILTGSTGTSLTCWFDSVNNYVWLMWYNGTSVKYAVRDQNLGVVLAPTTVVTTSGVSNLTGALTAVTTSTVYYERAGAENADNLTHAYTLTAAGTVTSISNVRSLGLGGKAFTYSGVTYAVAVHDSALQSTYFLIKPTGFNSYAQITAIGKLAPLVAGGEPARNTLSSTYATATGKYAFAYLVQTNPTTIDGVVQNTKAIQSAVFDFTSSPGKLTLANNLHLSGAILTNYDSGSSTEHGFNLFPEGGSQYTPLTLGGLLSDATYSYKFTYEWIDEFGQTHRSAPSTGLSVDINSTPGRASDSGTDTRITLTTNGDGTNSSRFVYPGVLLTDGFGTFAATTLITTIQDDNEVNIAPADTGPVFSIAMSLSSRKTFSYAISAGSGAVLRVTKPTLLVANGSLTNGSTQVFVAVTQGLVAGQGITDNTGDIPGGTTISSFSYRSGGALLTLSAAATATYDNAMVNITHATGWPITQWMHVGQTATGTAVPASTTITAIEDLSSTLAEVTLSAVVPATASGTLIISDAYNSRIDVPTLRVTEKGRVTQPVQIAVWRTTNGGTQYYKCGYAINDTTVDNVPFYDYTSDDELVGNTPLYTNGGEVENIAPPASDFLTSYKNRVILLPAEDGYSWWYSKQVVTGTPVEFSDLFTQGIDQRGGPLTGASPMDDKLIFFKQKDIFYVVGDGPAPSGANNDFSYPQLVTTPCGCTEPKSIITVPNGVIFKSAKGFYLLDRGLNVSYIGAEVEDYNSYTVTAAQLMATGTQVRFTMSGSVVLVYDYYVGQWSVFDSITAVDSVIYGTTYAYMTSAGLVAQETTGVYSDLGSVITSSFRTGWVSFDKIQNFQRLWTTLLVGQYYSPHTLTFQIAQDFDSTVSQTATVTLTSSITPYQLTFPTIQQKCEAAQLTFTCVPASVAGQGASFSALTFEAGIKKGANKSPASTTYGGVRS